MSEQGYLNFKRSIETTCTFTVDLDEDEDEYGFPICPFYARYYEVDNIQHFHVTNDTRRKICKFLSDNFEVEKNKALKNENILL
jgi:hypothetical protein